MTQQNKGGSCWQIRFSATEEYPETLTNFIDEYFTTSAIDYQDDGKEVLSAYADINFNELDFQEAAQNSQISLPSYEKTLLESSNWLKDYVIEFAPVEVADFLIYGIHEKSQPQTNKIPLQIYAATAFGSEHPTTRGCLEALCWLYHKKGFAPQNILDMGTGSGILALGAAKLLGKQSHITAVDIDDEAVIVTLQNAATNHAEEQINAFAGDGYKTPIVPKNAPYELIFSNILARPLIEMAPSLSHSLQKGGYCILSGFVEEQKDWVLKAHEEQGLKLIKCNIINNWCTAIMEKPND